MYGLITDLKRFAIHDGDGIRTTVFLKGCPLRCLWCHNPEGLSGKQQLAYYAGKCQNCGFCAESCPSGAHSFIKGRHTFDPALCAACGTCVAECPGSALTLYGKQVTPEDLLPLLLEDRAFYESSGGGVTLSGGECLMQPEFCAELLRLLKQEGIHTAVDTCGFVRREALDAVIPYADIFLYDLKAVDEDVHIRCTGQSNRLILDNLRYLDELGKAMEIRIHYVPGLNDHQLPKIRDFIQTLNHVTGVRLLPYHNYAGTKYAALGIPNTLPDTLPSQQEMELGKKLLSDVGISLK